MKQENIKPEVEWRLPFHGTFIPRTDNTSDDIEIMALSRIIELLSRWVIVYELFSFKFLFFTKVEGQNEDDYRDKVIYDGDKRNNRCDFWNFTVENPMKKWVM